MSFHCASDEMMQSRPELLLKQQQLVEIIVAKKATASTGQTRQFFLAKILKSQIPFVSCRCFI